MSNPRGFASDNYAGVLPEALAAIAGANEGHAPAYGLDPWTADLQEAVRREFGNDARAFPVFNGTAANVLSLRAVCRPWHAAIATASSHMHVDECGAPEAMAGIKLLTVPTPDGKLTPELVEPLLVRFGDEHAVQPRVVSITQSTELGTRYTRDEIAALADQAHERGLLLHLDGARIFNAAAGLDVPLRAITTDAGVDVLSLGGTKAGLLGAEAVVFLHGGEAAEEFRFVRKQSMQLASKMRFASAQLSALLSDDLWRRGAGHANAMARRLEDAVREIPGVTVTQPVEANAVFAILDPRATERLQQDWRFYVWDERTGEVRWMCSWDTTEDDVERFAADVRATLA